MRRLIPIIMILTAASLAVPAPASAQGQGQGQGRPDRPAAEKKKERARGPANAQGRGQATPPGQARERGSAGQPGVRGQGRGGPPAHARARRGGPAPDLASFNRGLVSRAAAVRSRRHGDGRRVDVRRDEDRIRVVREDGALLFSLDRADAERLGYWRVGVAQPFSATPRQRADEEDVFDFPDDDERAANGGAPAFCRSGEGHPVWGREWCVDKEFGLGDDDGLWGRATNIDDVIFRRPRTDREQLDRETLADILGDIVFGRLALQSLVLGADEPLTGRWLGQPDGPAVLRITAGDLEVAELVDADRDDEVDIILVNLGDDDD